MSDLALLKARLRRQSFCYNRCSCCPTDDVNVVIDEGVFNGKQSNVADRQARPSRP
jgi:hypothetical protein